MTNTLILSKKMFLHDYSQTLEIMEIATKIGYDTTQLEETLKIIKSRDYTQDAERRIRIDRELSTLYQQYSQGILNKVTN